MPEEQSNLSPEQEPVLRREGDQPAAGVEPGGPSPGPPASSKPAPGRTNADRWFDLMTDRELEDYIAGHLDPWGGDEGD